MKLPESIEALWDSLADECRRFNSKQKRQKRLGGADSKSGVHAAWNGETGCPCVVVESPIDPHPELTRLPEVLGLKTTGEPKNGGGGYWIVLEIQDSRHTDLFVALVNDLVAKLEAEDESENRIRIFLNRLYSWHRFFSRQGDGALSLMEQQGLWAEIHVLIDILSPSSSVDRALDMWCGPLREDRDFLGGGIGVEVKSTSGDQPVSLTINSEHQLDREGLKNLAIIHVHLHRIRGGDLTLNHQVEKLRTLVHGNTQLEELVENRLLEAGYFRKHADRYQDSGFHAEYHQIHEVGDGFPSLTPSMLPRGIGSVRYRLAEEALAEWRRDTQWLKEVLSEGNTNV